MVNLHIFSVFQGEVSGNIHILHVKDLVLDSEFSGTKSDTFTYGFLQGFYLFLPTITISDLNLRQREIAVSISIFIFTAV